MNARGLSSGLLTGPSGFTIGFDACRRRHVWPTDVEGAELDRVFHADRRNPTPLSLLVMYCASGVPITALDS